MNLYDVAVLQRVVIMQRGEYKVTINFWDNPYVEKLHKEILEVLSEGIYVSDAYGRTLAVNHMYEQLTGLKREEIVGKLVTDLKKEGSFDAILNPEIVISGQHKTTVQVTKTGNRVLLNGYPIFDESGKVILVLTFVRDITLMSQMKDQIVEQQEIIEKCRKVYVQNKGGLNNNFLIFKSEKMIRFMELLKKIAKTEATVLLLGETGVGKDVLSRKIHEYSLRRDEPFLKIDCSTIPENLIESELFGYDSGAFSGANNKGKIGLFEMADKGTLFLDEIGEIPLRLQVKLLRVLQDQEFMHIGSTKVKKVNVRFIAATNRDLEEEVQKGNFRSDLYYRLRVAVLEVPPLRERKEDICEMMRCFLDKYNAKYRKEVSFTKELEKALLTYKWPGNVREMDNFIQSLVVTNENEILDVPDLPHYMLLNPVVPDQSGINVSDKSLDELVADYEKNLLKKALALHGSVAKVAKILKVDRSTVFRKGKKYHLL
ncbi:sigma 54-interacting transcriptional regulator [Desulfitobacterium sp. AusDCA]